MSNNTRKVVNWLLVFSVCVRTIISIYIPGGKEKQVKILLEVMTTYKVFTRLFFLLLLLVTVAGYSEDFSVELGSENEKLVIETIESNHRIKRKARECDLDPKHRKLSYFDVIFRYGRPFLMSCLMKKQGFDERDCKQWSCNWTGSWMEFNAWCRWTGTDLCYQKHA